MPDDPRKSKAAGDPRGLIDAAQRQVEAIPAPSGSRSTIFSLRGRTKAELPPAGSFPGYQVEEEIHRGGQGVVFKALQESTQRHVAIKLLRDGALATEGEIARFEQEVRILGRLRHPNIVSIFDSHAADGRFYFVMDYIAGQPLDAYVRAQKCDLTKILGLFAKICDAVNVAHRHGIIHRDLKPGNIRVDEQGEPFVLDYGLSKLTDQPQGSSVTIVGQFVGSAPWAAPEQAAGLVDEIDTRTDVYALGVLLYQMITGEFPYSVEGPPGEVLQQVRYAEPTPPRTHRPGIPVDVSTIALKCLQKDSARRYQTAGELGRDIEHYLAGEPIEARRDNTWYVVRKSLQRHRVSATVIGLVALLIVQGVVALAVGYGREARLRAEAEQQTAIARAVLEFLTEDVLNGINPEVARGRELTLHEVFDEAAARVETAFDDDPLTKATIHETIGRVYYKLGSYADAEPHLRAALETRQAQLGSEHRDTLGSMNDVAMLLLETGDYAGAETLFGELLDIQRRVYGEQDPATSYYLANLAVLVERSGRYWEAEPLAREALRLSIESLGAEHPDTLTSMSHLAMLLHQLGDLEEAERLCRRALELHRRVHGDDHPATVAVLGNLAELLRDIGDINAAESTSREVLETSLLVLGDDHPDSLIAMNNLASLLRASGQPVEAESLIRRAITNSQRARGGEYPETLEFKNQLASLLQDNEQYEESERWYRDVLSGRRRVLGDEHPDTLVAMNNLGTVLMDLDRLHEAESLLGAASAAAKRVLPEDHIYRPIFLGTWGKCLHWMERYEQSEAALLAAYEGWRSLPDPDPEDIEMAMGRLVDLYESWERPEKADSWRSTSSDP